MDEKTRQTHFLGTQPIRAGLDPLPQALRIIRQQHIFSLTPLCSAEIFLLCDVSNIFIIAEAKCSAPEIWRSLSSPILQTAQSSHTKRILSLVIQEILWVGAQLFQEVKHPFCSFDFQPLDALLEADCKALPSTQVLLVRQALSWPQLGLFSCKKAVSGHHNGRCLA